MTSGVYLEKVFENTRNFEKKEFSMLGFKTVASGLVFFFVLGKWHAPGESWTYELTFHFVSKWHAWYSTSIVLPSRKYDIKRISMCTGRGEERRPDLLSPISLHSKHTLNIKPFQPQKLIYLIPSLCVKETQHSTLRFWSLWNQGE